ncbi:DUF2977 domain-containing protein [Mammaliicoccus sp. A-M4]|uniref:DUF2977 domain-containing protein n=1 Tax=Mammaliicoccus sp. A-M4 TaxID=2898664 RepID=UPI001EFBC8AB|nr:DUF2977 domain-containing protein [Mammaliicoccus sp. A-M4]
MQIVINNRNEITSYALVGSYKDGIEINDIPSRFIIDFKPRLYVYSNGQIVLNENYSSGNNEQPIQPPNISMPGSDEELRKMFAEMQVQLVQANMMVMQLSQQNARLSQEMVVINQKLEEVTNNEDVIPKV